MCHLIETLRSLVRQVGLTPEADLEEKYENQID